MSVRVIAALAHNTLREAVRNKILYALLFFAVLMIGSGTIVSSLSYVENARILLEEEWRPGMHLAEALALAIRLLGADPGGGEPRELTPAQLEVAVLDRHRPRRRFRRVQGPLLDRLLSADDPTADVPVGDESDSTRSEATNPQTQRPATDPGTPE